MEHGHSLVIPPHFDENNYAYWKVRMKAFLKSIDERVWNSVEYGWKKPTTPVSEWQTSQKEADVFNSKAMNAIFNAVSMEEFKRISNVEVAHTAWNILQTVHEVSFSWRKQTCLFHYILCLSPLFSPSSSSHKM